jgi:hypothetical protein
MIGAFSFGTMYISPLPHGLYDVLLGVGCSSLGSVVAISSDQAPLSDVSVS